MESCPMLHFRAMPPGEFHWMITKPLPIYSAIFMSIGIIFPRNLAELQKVNVYLTEINTQPY